MHVIHWLNTPVLRSQAVNPTSLGYAAYDMLQVIEQIVLETERPLPQLDTGQKGDKPVGANKQPSNWRKIADPGREWKRYHSTTCMHEIMMLPCY